MTQETGTFFDEDGDRRMEKQNRKNWGALCKRALENPVLRERPSVRLDVVDWGSHKGGLLHMLVCSRSVGRLMGVEPLVATWPVARKRVARIEMFSDIFEVPALSADILVSHEVLYLVQDLRGAMREVRRVLRPNGVAFIALGSHGENTAWLRWRLRLEELYGHRSWVHQPINILNAGVAAGFHMEVGRLHTEPQISESYWPAEDGWGEFVSVEEMLKHRGWKYVFTCYPK